MQDLPIGAEIDADQLWSQILNRPQTPPNGGGRRAALFLDRDGVINEDTHYLHRPGDVQLIDGAARVIAAANRRAVPVIVVTNQAGIARGKFGWDDFMAVQEKIIDDLDRQGAFFNAVFACPHHADGAAPLDNPNHPWRKPNPGMLLEAALRLPIDLGASWLIGDRAGDLQAAKTAGLAGGIHVLSGHGKDAGEREGAVALGGKEFQSLTADSIGDAETLLALLGD
ncbi:MAG: HAD family hydrolase [Alphaproteobacteria bacterium]|jgi:D-glycero-D-manno-heptose 1,7-bisphosphate phosphatase|nr:HAD family hydrolase [Alphaproteobacteria bacterium]MBT7942588.1 HAD family hydrolase [Alphaproteobacteria bacterium]